MNTRNNIRLHTLVALLTAACTIVVASSANATTITYLDQDTSTGANWRTNTTLKAPALDPNGDNAYGSDGYYMLTVTSAIVISTPSYIVEDPTHNGLKWANAGPSFDDPTQSIGAAVSNVNAGLIYNPGASPIVSFSVDEAASFVLTIVLAGSTAGHRPTALSVTQVVGGAATDSADSLSSIASTPAYLFFLVDAQAGDAFNVVTSGTSQHGISGVAFEAVPEPATMSLLAIGGLGVLLKRRRRRA
ncbi:MAG: PEP-CTERM sorting domain-containing protein [Phycisphaerae bacterium]|nr:PEP-CTERM sorting domain-containing protein [Phycisphaerae bacterium]